MVFLFPFILVENFHNSALGNYRAYITNPKNAVVQDFSGEIVVVTPANLWRWNAPSGRRVATDPVNPLGCENSAPRRVARKKPGDVLVCAGNLVNFHLLLNTF